MDAATAVIGQRSWRWSKTRTLNFLGWLNINQKHVASTLTLMHKILNTHKPANMYRSMLSPYSYQISGAAGGQLRAS